MKHTILWLRRDLRLEDHAALHTALHHPEPVLPLFIFDTNLLRAFPNKDDRRLSFIARTLCQLQRQLQQRGSELLVLHGNPETLVPNLAAQLNARVIASEDYEPGSQLRDQSIAHALGEDARFVKDHVIFAPYEITRERKPYRVFTHFANAWQKALGTEADEYQTQDRGRYATIPALIDLPILDVGKGAKAMLEAVGYRYRDDPLWKPEDTEAHLQSFIAGKLHAYPTNRDIPALEGTSRLSPYLRFGLVSARRLYREARGKSGGDSFIKELIWRDFFAHLLYHFPETVTKEFLPQFRALSWRSDPASLESWKEGTTGYPLVDAGMRELKETGTMHNRVRMVAASFLTKHLLLDWRLGEAHFAQALMDYDQAPNIGNWQWAASVGCDAQPWFRIFNPSAQAEKFDPENRYIRRFVPEFGTSSYPAPIVEHTLARARALAFYKESANKG